MSTDYDCWIAGQDPYYDCDPDWEPEPVMVEMTFIMDRKGGRDPIRAFVVRGQWVEENREFWEGEMQEMDEDGIVIADIEPANPDHDALWIAATNAMADKKYEDMEYL